MAACWAVPAAFTFTDIIFIIYLYQRYVYRVDPKRVNEFGTSADMFDKDGKIITTATGNGEAVAAVEGVAVADDSGDVADDGGDVAAAAKSDSEKKDDWREGRREDVSGRRWHSPVREGHMQ